MSLITRCPACGTMFKVVTDQLKVSQGWVRCGHCTEVFDASLHLQTTQNPVPASLPASQTNTDVEAPVPVEFETPAVPPSTPQEQAHPAPQQLADSAVSDEVSAVSAAAVADTADAKVELLGSAQTWDTDLVSKLSDDLPEVLPDEDVSFVRNSKRQAYWRRPVVRFSMGLAGFMLAAALLVQFSVQQRDRLAAMEPRLNTWLQLLCEPLQCEIAPFRHIEAVVIDSSSFNKINNDFYRLSFALKNTGTIPVAMPSLEVTLTDTQEQALTRRVVTPAEFGVTDNGGLLSAGADFSGVIVMQVLSTDAKGAAGVAAPAATPLRVAGYRVLAFYP